MPKATFTKQFTWAPKRGVRIVYEAGKTYGVTSACHAEAVKAGAVPMTSGGSVSWIEPVIFGDDSRG